MVIKYIVSLPNSEEMKLKDYLLELKLSRKFCRKVKLYGKMYINDSCALNYFLVKNGDEITLEYSESMNEDILDINKDLDVLYEDDYLLVINKEHDLASQPSHRHQEDNLISYVKNYFTKKGITSNIHLVNRLDFSTSGIVVIAKEGFIHNALTNHIIEKKYIGKIKGTLNPLKGEINLPIERVSPNSIKRMVRDDGKTSITKYNTLEVLDNESIVEFTLLTGRTHQIRVHTSTLNHPLVGDKLYGDDLNQQFLYLHSYYISFYHPITKEIIKIEKYPIWYKVEA